jgi:Methyltransferase domain
VGRQDDVTRPPENFWQTDKVWPHRYFQQYARIAGILGPQARVLELGVQGGESLLMWRGLFPLAAEIVGVDCNHNSRWPEGTIRVVAFQDDPGLPGMTGGGPFDLIVDDASHDGNLTRKSFDLLWPLLAPGGFYVIEDWAVALRPGDEPGETWGQPWGDSMLRCAESFLPMLDRRDAECESIEYRYGLIIIRRRGPG